MGMAIWPQAAWQGAPLEVCSLQVNGDDHGDDTDLWYPVHDNGNGNLQILIGLQHLKI